MSSREFNQFTGEAKKAAQDGAVFITDRGRTTHVLLSYDDFQRLSGGQSILDALAQPEGVGSIDFDPPRIDLDLRIPEFD